MSSARADSPAVNQGRAGWSRTRRFVPPTVNSFMPDAEREVAAAVEAARANGLAEGQARGWSEGRESGLREGETKARGELQQRIAALELDLTAARGTHAVGESLARLLASRDADRAAMEAECRSAIAAALRVLFPALLARGFGEEVAGLVTEALSLRQAERIVARAHPQTAAASLLRDLAAAAGDRLVLDWDEAMSVASVDIAWADGGLVADWDALLARILEVFDGGAPSEPVPPS